MERPISISEKKKERELALAADRRRLMESTPEKALELLTDHPYPVSLVQSFAEEDLYFLVHGIGADDALPVLALASNDQWEYVLDMETWRADRPDNRELTCWLERLRKADADRFTNWIIHDRSDLLTYYLNRNVEVFIREYEQDPAEVGEGFFSEDDTHYVRLRPIVSDDPQDSAFASERDTFVLDLLKRISVYDYMTYQGVLLESSVLLPAEAEEELLRLRTVRLAEKGFLPLEDAVGVYEPLTVAELLRRPRTPSAVGGRPVESYPLPFEAPHATERGDWFGRTLALIKDPRMLERLQTEFAGLCNQVAAADQRPVRLKSDLRRVVEKVSGYIGLGLEKVMAEMNPEDAYAAPNLLRTHLLADIFRVGYGCALALKWKAEQWQRRSWAHASGLPLSFWGEAWLGVLGGLLLKKPLFFGNFAGGSLYREFGALTDISQSAQTLDQIMAMDALLSRLALNPAFLSGKGVLTYASLLLTLWADDRLGLPCGSTLPVALTREQFRVFFDRLWEEPTTPRRVSDTARQDFLRWLAERSGQADFEIAERLRLTLEQLFALVESELGGVAVEDLDPRFIYLFCLEA